MGRLDGKVALIVGGGADGPPNPGETLSIGNGRATAIIAARRMHDGALYVSSDNTGYRGKGSKNGAIYRIALLGK